MIARLLRVALAASILNGCTAPPPDDTTTPPPEPPSYVYLYARLHETQPKSTAEAQYLPNLRKALARYPSNITVEEITGTEGTVEFIGIDFRIAAPESATEGLETLLMNTFRLSGAPYATQIFIVTP